MDDRELVRRALEGDRLARERLGIRVDQGVRRFFSRMRDDDVAAELAQRTAFDLIVKFLQHKSVPKGDLDGWIMAFSFMQLKQWFTSHGRERRRAQLRSEYAAIMPARPDHDEKTFAASEKLQLVRQMINQLPDKLRDTYEARVEGSSYAEIAAMFEISETTARRRVHAARRRIDKFWERMRVTQTQFRTPSEAS